MKELKTLKVLQAAIEGHIRQREAAARLGKSERQVRRIIKAVREVGDVGVVHKARGKPSKRRISEETRQRVLRLYEDKYVGFGPTFAVEKMKEQEGIEISDEKMRQLLMEAGHWKGKRQKKKHLQWRARRECFGELVQIDGSHHDWLEGRGPEIVLMGYIDDATNRVYGRFYEYEGRMPAMDSFKRYVRDKGLPMSVYVDRHSTYKSTRKLTPEEELAGKEKPKSQFERALEELGVELIPAGSPQAKGRVERLFGVLQDRLVKEMRLVGVKTMEEANEFLEEYLPRHNGRFAVKPANGADAHVRVPQGYDLDAHLCMKTLRTIGKDNTVACNGRLYQLENNRKAGIVTVEERLDGGIRITLNGESLKYRVITERPVKVREEVKRAYKKPAIPATDHPWRKPTKPRDNRKVWANAD